MTQIRKGDLDAVLDEVFRRLKDLDTTSPVGFTSITRGALRVASPEGLIVEGSASVTGTLDVSGVENIDGTLNVTGTTNLSGTTSVTGPTEITGATGITGDLDIEGETSITGDVSLTGDLTVEDGGAIKVNGTNPITLEVDGSGRASVNFSTGYVVGDANGVTVYSNAGYALYINSSGIRFAAMPTKTAAETGLTAGAVYADTSGYLYRVTA